MAHRLAPDGEADLQDTWFYVARESGSVEVADRLIDSITTRFLLLAHNPHLGRRRLRAVVSDLIFTLTADLSRKLQRGRAGGAIVADVASDQDGAVVQSGRGVEHVGQCQGMALPRGLVTELPGAARHRWG